MPNFDVAVGITQTQLTALLGKYYDGAYYSGPPSGDSNPFKGTKSVQVKGLGQVTVDWDVTAAPTLALGAPDETTWGQARNSTGQTNADSKTPLPSGLMAQVEIPSLTAHYTEGGHAPVGGTATNTVLYGTLDCSNNQITITPVAVTIDETGFTVWDQAIFNNALLPQIFIVAAQMLSVITVPPLTIEGVGLGPLSITFADQLLVASSVMTRNTGSIDVSGVTWPQDPLFVLVSQDLINEALAQVSSQIKGKTEGEDNVPFTALKQHLADYSWSGSVDSATLTVDGVSPLTLDASVNVSGSASASLTAEGMALAAAGCALGSVLAI